MKLLLIAAAALAVKMDDAPATEDLAELGEPLDLQDDDLAETPEDLDDLVEVEVPLYIPETNEEAEDDLAETADDEEEEYDLS